MIILLIIGILLTGLAIGSLARVTIWPRGGHMRSGGLREKIDEVATTLGSAVGGRSKGRSDQRVKRDLIAAGMYNVTPGRFLGYRVLCGIAFPLLWIWLGATVGVKPVQVVLV